MFIIEQITPFIEWFITHPFKAFVLLFIEYAVLFELWHRTKGTMFEKPYKLIFGYLIFVPQDLLMNWILSFIFLDPPAELFELVTKRMKRYKRLKHNHPSILVRWRYNFAFHLCEHLNPYDAHHC